MIPVFYHIPKCGGTYFYDTCLFPSMKLKLRNEYGPNHNIANINIDGLFMIANMEQSLDISGNLYLSKDQVNQYIQSGKLKEILAFKITSECNYSESKSYIYDVYGKNTFYITIFRNPINRINSLFYYLRDYGVWEDGHSDIKNISFDEYINTHMPSNWITRHVCGLIDGQICHDNMIYAMNEFSNYKLIGSTEKINQFLNRAEAEFGISYNPLNWDMEKRDINKNTKSKDRQMTNEQTEKIFAANTYDNAIYREFCGN